MITGGGHSPLKETMSILGIPIMNKPCFQKTENDIGKWWSTRLQEAMLDAGREEKRLAEERNDYHQEVPAITVIVDGGWSKRSHKHSYNAKSGVGIIIGQATGKLLLLVYETSTVRHVPNVFHRANMNVTRTGTIHHLKWSLI